ncbi:hypothetical protein BAUCODRAFT_163794 [Baudoinia panamericana UAMH 10762]|uniref:Uncharacterized protein n=1 Tax=Baudoinia panamericana (strain UAMH 10762) TaxID=717646 RepID=M2M094_BAUPA|nr:uncharacterized protein BAUCODRAFT_163794 [Baudoinia panamericana UAMH 10762]EMD00418.1 hypothetical protein BAUCODRAFT_163794 [Baudoinia panamericana UAMH 10762]
MAVGILETALPLAALVSMTGARYHNILHNVRGCKLCITRCKVSISFDEYLHFGRQQTWSSPQ